jgi:two-component system, NarL family, sensor kinase
MISVPSRGQIARPVAVFALSGLVVLVLVAVGGWYATQGLAREQAVREAKLETTIAGRGIVEPALTTGVVRGDPAALARLDRVIRSHVKSQDVARIKIWTADGKILYSDLPLLIGRRFELGSAEERALRTETTATEATNSSSPENTFERNLGALTSVYLGLRAQDGTPVLYEEYLRSSAIAGNSRTVARLFAPVGIAALLVLALVQIPLAWRMARRIRSAQEDRQVLLQRAVDASEEERRSIAAGLHDGVVQELAGHSFAMAAALERHDGEGELRQALSAGAAGTRNAIRQLRSLLLEIYPRALRDHGLSAALPDLAAPLAARGVDVTVDVPERLAVSEQTEQLIFRTAQEAVRNISAHADAGHASIEVTQTNGAVTLRIADDGRGFDPETAAARRVAGHMGLSILEELALVSGGTLAVESAPGAGTTVRLEVPAG